MALILAHVTDPHAFVLRTTEVRQAQSKVKCRAGHCGLVQGVRLKNSVLIHTEYHYYSHPYAIKNAFFLLYSMSANHPWIDGGYLRKKKKKEWREMELSKNADLVKP